MDARELRIGNLIKLFIGIDDNGANYRECIISGIMEQYGSQYYLFNNIWVEISNNLEPIPLTEEWLIKFGLYEIENGYYEICENISINIDLYVYCGRHCICELLYVHQLQNLYYALTCEELTLNKN